MLATINERGRTEGGITARVAATAGAIEAAWRDGVCAVVPAVENGHAIGDDLGLLGGSASWVRSISRWSITATI